MAIRQQEVDCDHSHTPMLIGPVNGFGYAPVESLQDRNYQVAKELVVRVEPFNDPATGEKGTIASIPKLDGTGEPYVYSYGGTTSEALVGLKCLTLSYHSDLVPPNPATQAGDALKLARFLDSHIRRVI